MAGSTRHYRWRERFSRSVDTGGRGWGRIFRVKLGLADKPYNSLVLEMHRKCAKADSAVKRSTSAALISRLDGFLLPVGLPTKRLQLRYIDSRHR